MNKMLKQNLPHIFFVLLFAHSSLCAVGQGVVSSGSAYRDSLYQHITRENIARLSCRFTYSQGSSVVHPDLGINSVELSRLDSFIRYSTNHPDLHIKHIRLTGYSSVEGRYFDNENLSRDRITGFYHYLRDHYPALYRYSHDMAWVAEDWKLLSSLVRESDLNERDEVLEIIRRVHTFDDREALLMKLNGGRVYEEISRTLFPLLRRVEIEIEYSLTPALSKREGVGGNIVDPLIYNILNENRDNNWYSRSERPSETKSSLTQTLSKGDGATMSQGNSLSFGEGRGKALASTFFLKTNTLLWAGVMPDLTYTTPVANIALEYTFTRHWSIEAGAAYSYWHYKGKEKFQGLSGYSIEPRYNTQLLHDNLNVYLGLYGRVGDYDLRYTENHTGKYGDAGLSGGLSFRLVGNLGVEVGARVGYISTQSTRYEIDGTTNLFVSRQSQNKIKVTGLNLSLVYKLR